MLFRLVRTNERTIARTYVRSVHESHTEKEGQGNDEDEEEEVREGRGCEHPIKKSSEHGRDMRCFFAMSEIKIRT